MKLTKAIEIKEKYQYLLSMESHPELIIADNLSNEALKKILNIRILFPTLMPDPLPGETAV